MPPPTADDLDTVLHAQRPTFGRILGRFGIPPEDAEDLLQEVVCHFLLKRPQIHSPEPWLRSVLRNRCRLYWRKRLGSDEMRARAVAWGLAPPVDVTGGSEADLNTRVDLATALARLPRWKRELLLRHDVRGEDEQELARRFDYRVASIRKTVCRLRKEVRSHLAKRGYAAATGDPSRKEKET